jgi:putative hydrolase of the HAD superfamily
MRLTTLLLDLDNTLYPADNGLLLRVDARINDYIAEWLSLSGEEARALRRRYVETYGTTLQGLRAEHALDVEAFLAYAHDHVPLEEHLVIDTELDAALARIELEKVVFTNAPRRWARRVLEFLQLTGHFRDVCDLEFMDYQSKPLPEAFHRVLKHLDRQAQECLLVDDTPRNLAAARELGIRTILIGEAQERPDYADAVVARASQVPEVIEQWRAHERE